MRKLLNLTYKNMATKKAITEGAVKQLISETAKYLKKKEEIWVKALQLEKELKTLNESHNTLTTSFGFDNQNDKSKSTKSGFVKDNGPISNLTSLGAEIQEAKEKALAEEEMNKDLPQKIQELKNEIEKLKSDKK